MPRTQSVRQRTLGLLAAVVAAVVLWQAGPSAITDPADVYVRRDAQTAWAVGGYFAQWGGPVTLNNQGFRVCSANESATTGCQIGTIVTYPCPAQAWWVAFIHSPTRVGKAQFVINFYQNLVPHDLVRDCPNFTSDPSELSAGAIGTVLPIVIAPNGSITLDPDATNIPTGHTFVGTLQGDSIDGTFNIPRNVDQSGFRWLDGASFSVHLTTSPPGFSLSSVRPVQVVFDVPMIKGRSTAFEVNVVTPSSQTSAPFDTLVAEIEAAGRTETMSINPNDWRPDPAGGFRASVFVNPTPRFTFQEGVIPLTARLKDLSGTEIHALTIQLQVIKPRELSLVYVPIIGISGIPSNIPHMVNDSAALIQRIFPLADGGLRAIHTLPAIESPLPFGLGIRADLLQVGLRGFVTNPFADRIIGIVTQGYLTTHLIDAPAVAMHPFPVVLTQNGLIPGPAHEIGHTYGLQLNGEEYDEFDNDIGQPVTSFDVAANQRLLVNYYCFMGGADGVQANAWIAQDHYLELLDKLRPAEDPELLIVSAQVNQNDTIELGDWRYAPAGTATPDQAGPYAIRVVDVAGNATTSLSLALPAELLAERMGRIALDQHPLLAKVPFGPGSVALEFLHDGTLMKRVWAAPKLLGDAIRALPDAAFTSNSGQTRASFLATLAGIESMLEGGNFPGASSALAALRASASAALVDLVITDPMQTTRANLLGLIDQSRSRLGATATSCDTDADGDVDIADLQSIRAANGQAVQGSDPRDGNGDGRINVADYRFCQLRTTRR